MIMVILILELLSVNSSLVDNRKDFVVNFSYLKVKRYKVSKVSVKSSIKKYKKIRCNF